MKEKYIDKILELSKKAMRKDCVPVGAIVVKDNQIIGEGYNKKDITNNPLDHAEIIAIKNACKKIKSWNLSSCELYVTMHPCAMCKSVISETRMKEVYYIVENEKEKYKNLKSVNEMSFNKIENVEIGKLYVSFLRDFFSEKRKKSRKKEQNVV